MTENAEDGVDLREAHATPEPIENVIGPL